MYRKEEEEEKEDGEFIEHVACPFCTSSDGFAIYHHPDRGYNGTCWVAGCKRASEMTQTEDGYIPRSNTKDWVKKKTKTTKYHQEEQELSKYSLEEVQEFPFVPWTERKLKKEVYELFGVRAMGQKGVKPPVVDTYFYPNYLDNEIVGYKTRRRFVDSDKEVQKGKVEAGVFKCFKGYVGHNKKGIQLFGQQLHDTAPRRTFIIGGQEDVMASYQMMVKKTKMDIELGDLIPGYGFVGPQNGESDTDIKLNLDWFDTAEEIYLCFDNDDAGRECTEKVAKLFDPSKLKIMSLKSLQVNDPSDALKEGKTDDWYRAIWNARPYSPTCITHFADALERMKDRGDWSLIPFPESFGEMNERTFGGYALGEIVNIIGPTSIGKSSVTEEMVLEAIVGTDHNIGVITLEADLVEYSEKMTSLVLSERIIKIPHDERDWNAIEAAHNVFEDRIYLIEDMGSMKGEEEFWDKVNFLVSSLDCKVILFDPATLGVKAARMDEEEFLADLVSFVKRKKIAWVNVCHTRKTSNDQKAGSKGAETNEEDLKGSGAWIQNSMINMIVTRNKMHEHPEVKNTMKMAVTKIRRNGSGTGIAGYVKYDVNTGRLVKGRDPMELVGDEDE